MGPRPRSSIATQVTLAGGARRQPRTVAVDADGLWCVDPVTGGGWVAPERLDWGPCGWWLTVEGPVVRGPEAGRSCRVVLWAHRADPVAWRRLHRAAQWWRTVGAKRHGTRHGVHA